MNVEQEIAEVVQKHGWYPVSVSDHQPPFLYSIGLMQTLNHPEFIVFGLNAEDLYALISQLVRDIRGGQSYIEPGVYTVVFCSVAHRVGFRPVHLTQHELYLGFAMGYCRHIGRRGQLEAVQVFWSDSPGKFPFDSGCELDVYQRQPRLDIGLTPDELQQWQRQWE